MNKNQLAYSENTLLKKYSDSVKLQISEKVIFETYENKISTGNVLDIGIGAGRTTIHLSKIAKNYTGIDFSQLFVDYCKKLFAEKSNVNIEFGDARNLNSFTNQSFDFILFSFNGIDCVDFEGRAMILAEFKRLLKSDGILCFSFHNKYNIDKLYSFQTPKNPFKYWDEWKRKNRVALENGKKEQFITQDWFILKDGADNFKVDCLYIDALYQKKCLQNIGFNHFTFFDSISGKVLNECELQQTDTPWIYVCAQF